MVRSDESYIFEDLPVSDEEILEVEKPGNQQYNKQELARIQTESSKVLAPIYFRSKDAPWGGQLSYITPTMLSKIANDIYGPDGWRTEVRQLVTDYVHQNGHGDFDIAISAIARITLKDGSHHEDVGVASGESLPDRTESLKQLQIHAINDAVKRAFRQFGEALGNCLYDKELPELIEPLGRNIVLVQGWD